MTDYTLAAAVAQSKTNLLAIAQLALTDVAAAYPYVTAQANTANIFQLTTSGYRVQAGLPGTGMSQNQQTWTFAVNLRLRVDQWLAGADGQTYEQAAWDYLPTAAQYFEQHRGLTYPSITQRVPYLDVDNTRCTTAAIRMETATTGTLVAVDFAWNLVYLTAFPRLCV